MSDTKKVQSKSCQNLLYAEQGAASDEAETSIPNDAVGMRCRVEHEGGRIGLGRGQEGGQSDAAHGHSAGTPFSFATAFAAFPHDTVSRQPSPRKRNEGNEEWMLMAKAGLHLKTLKNEFDGS